RRWVQSIDRDSASRETETAFRPNRTCSQLNLRTRALDGRLRLESHHAHPPRSLRPLLLDTTWASWAMGDARGVVSIRIDYRIARAVGGPGQDRIGSWPRIVTPGGMSTEGVFAHKSMRFQEQITGPYPRRPLCLGPSRDGSFLLFQVLGMAAVMILLVIWPYNTETRGLLQVHVARYFRMKNEVSKTEESSSSTTNKLFTNTTDNAGNSYSIPFIPVKLRFMDNDAIELQNLHIPKTGGRTFIRYLDDFQIRHVSSEGSFKDDRIINSEFVSTILREPTRHVLAQWNHCRGKEGSNKPFAWVPFTAWVKYWSEFNLQYNGSFERHIFNTYKGTFQVPEGDPFNCFYIPINLQASRLGAFDKNIAEKRISTLFFVGVQDMFAEPASGVRGDDGVYPARPSALYTPTGPFSRVHTVALGPIQAYAACLDAVLA
ncbi:hypothetical protein THAOC_05506, partial [Thalassiosira oceanica]